MMIKRFNDWLFEAEASQGELQSVLTDSLQFAKTKVADVINVNASYVKPLKDAKDETGRSKVLSDMQTKIESIKRQVSMHVASHGNLSVSQLETVQRWTDAAMEYLICKGMMPLKERFKTLGANTETWEKQYDPIEKKASLDLISKAMLKNYSVQVPQV